MSSSYPRCPGRCLSISEALAGSRADDELCEALGYDSAIVVGPDGLVTEVVDWVTDDRPIDLVPTSAPNYAREQIGTL